jgi:hypothetical protein
MSRLYFRIHRQHFLSQTPTAGGYQVISLTESQAFEAMILFPHDYYERTKSDEIAALLGGWQIVRDGKPADPAAWEDWMKCAGKVVREVAKNPDSY